MQRLKEKSLQAETHLKAAQAELAAALAEQARIELDLRRVSLRAPFAGVLEQRDPELGSLVQAGDAVAEVVDPLRLKAVGHVPQQSAGRVAEGQQVRIRLLDGRSTEDVLTYVAPVADPATRSFRVEAEVANAEGRLRAGVSAELSIAVATEQAPFLLPAALTLDDLGRVGVKSVDAANTVHFHPVDLIRKNNMLVAAGATDTGAGRLVLKVPGVIETIEDILSMPVKVAGSRVVTFGDVASVRRGFKDAEGFARVAGQPAVTLEVKKRVGANIIETVSAVRAIVEEQRSHWPAGIQVAYMQDKSKQIRHMLGDLQNNLVSAVVLVMIVILAALDGRSALLVGAAIPGSFLAAILVLDSLGFTLNIVVLFSLILVVGMLVDGAIVVSELAGRRLHRGVRPRDAYAGAARRMAWPVIASTLTTLAVFLPLLGWRGMVGEFMKYLPITVIIALTASLFMALIFIPVLGATITRRPRDPHANRVTEGTFTRRYSKLLEGVLRHPGKTLLAALLALVGAYGAYAWLGKSVEFFPEVEPEFALVYVHARGDLSVHEKDALVRQVESRILDMPEFESVYARSFNQAGGPATAEDVVGTIQLELIDWDQRRKAAEIMQDVRARTADIPGILVEIRKQENGPSGGKPIQVEFSSRDPDRIPVVVARARFLIEGLGGFVDAEDNRPLPGIEWRLQVNRERAAQYGADVAMLGNAVQMVTNGIKVSDYRPDDSDDEVDIRVRFPYQERNLGQLDQLRVQTDKGMVPISNFVTLTPAPKTGTLSRVDARRVITLQADVADGLLVDDQTKRLQAALQGADLDPEVSIGFKGEDQDQRESAEFLSSAFAGAIFLMGLILVTQFNSVYQALLVLSAIVFSTAGVLLGLLVTNQAFGVVMVGLGVIALAGIVVNNNIVLIDTFNRLRGEGLQALDAAVETGRRRLRPVVLTALTTVLGLLPMVMAMNIDLINRAISFGAPSTQWWTQLASAIAGGLSFATVLTLILTPCMLVMGERWSEALQRRFAAAHEGAATVQADRLPSPRPPYGAVDPRINRTQTATPSNCDIARAAPRPASAPSSPWIG